MNIKFKLINEQKVEIVNVDDKGEHVIGQIFSPSSSGNDVKNAIQVCGFVEAFDLWGCGVFGKKAHETNERMKIRREINQIQATLHQENYPLCTTERRLALHKEHERVQELEEKLNSHEQVKDIQLMFTEHSERHSHPRGTFDYSEDCIRCFNKPCTCEVKIAYENPYTVKREQDLWLEKEKKKGATDLKVEDPEVKRTILGKGDCGCK